MTMSKLSSTEVWTPAITITNKIHAFTNGSEIEKTKQRLQLTAEFFHN